MGEEFRSRPRGKALADEQSRLPPQGKALADEQSPSAKQAADIFLEMAELLDIRGGDPYRARSFRRAAKILEKLDEPLEDALRFGALRRRRGIGDGTIARLSEIMRSGSCRDLVALRGDMPSGVRELLAVRGIGPKTVRLLYTHLRIGSIEELERAARTGQLSKLPRFGERGCERIIAAIENHRKSVSRTPLPEALRLGNRLIDALAAESAALEITLTGSARRRKETVGDLDILVATYEPLKLASLFCTLDDVAEVLVKGDKKTSVRLETGQQADLRLVVPETYGAGLHYFTGSQQHNIFVRARGNRRKLKISEYGIFSRVGEVRLAGQHEHEVFNAVGLPFIAPELREAAGELEAAEQGRLPALVEEAQILGDLHVHTAFPHRREQIEELAKAAAQRGLRYLAITNHSQALISAGGLSGEQLLQLKKRCQQVAPSFPEIRLLAGVEVEILPNGELDLDPAVLEQLDWVVAGAHTSLEQDRKTLTERLVKAVESGLIDVLAHPMARTLPRKEGPDIDFELLFHRAARAGVALEINGAPTRLDLSADLARQARRHRVALALGSDAKTPEQLGQLQNAIYTARRGWLGAHTLLNCLPADALEEHRNRRRSQRRSQHNAPPKTPAVAELHSLQQALAARPLAEETRARLQEWIHGKQDPELLTALELMSANPTQKAFELLWHEETET
jgi:DNA polymerase (family 10)